MESESKRTYYELVGAGILALGIGLGFGSCQVGCSVSKYLDKRSSIEEKESLKERIGKVIYVHPKLEDMNLDEKNIRFYRMDDGTRAVTEIDGEPILEFLKKK